MLMMYRGRVSASRRGLPSGGDVTRRERSMSGARLAPIRIRAIRRNADLPRLDLFGLRDAQRQDAIGELRLGALALHPDRELDAAAERAEAALAVQVLVATDLLVGLELAAQGQVLAGHGDLDVIGLHAWQGGSDDDLVVRLVHVDGGAA